MLYYFREKPATDLCYSTGSVAFCLQRDDCPFFQARPRLGFASPKRLPQASNSQIQRLILSKSSTLVSH
jgi:hypothetical protein